MRKAQMGEENADTHSHAPVDYTVHGPDKTPGTERVFLSGEKEQQGDYVFTATSPGEYRFCFDNGLSTFSDKVVDFEISVRTPSRPFSPPCPTRRLSDIANSTGRKRIPSRLSPSKSRRLQRTARRRRRIHHASFRTGLDAHQTAKVFPHAGESEFQHGAQY